ncbi:MAG: hypothetical protein Q8R15_01940 [Candidatus Micrarchaeota archaeon]|nr:hypothetical protein [Candidatus Micrarchaeota archaeon]
MGNFILIEAKQVSPSQNFLKEKTLGYVLACYFDNREADLPPAPIVRLIPGRNAYVAIDGHNILAIDDLLQRKTKVYVAASYYDQLTSDACLSSSQEGLKQRNNDLKQKFDQCLIEAKNLEKEQISSFSDLRRKYDFLSTIESAKEHYNL